MTDRTVRPDATLLRLVQSELQELLRYLPAEERPADESALLRQALRAIEETRHPPSEIQLPETKGQDVPALSAQLVERVVQNMRQEIPVLPGEKLPDYAALIRQASGLLAQNEAQQDNNGAIRAVLATLAGAGQFDSAVLPAENAQGSLVSAEALRYVQAEQDKAHGIAKNPQNDLSERALASAARELEKQGQLTLPP
ncbi:conjugal transfer protein TraI, partial [Rahnella aceris]